MSNRNILTIAFLVIFGILISIIGYNRYSFKIDTRSGVINSVAVIPDTTTESIIRWIKFNSEKECRDERKRRISNVKVRRK